MSEETLELIIKLNSAQALLAELEKPMPNLSTRGVLRFQQEQIIYLIKQLAKIKGTKNENDKSTNNNQKKS